jgi:hypothetical protein
MNTPNTFETLQKSFAPLYSYQLPAWWQTSQGMMLIGISIVSGITLIGTLVWYKWWYKPPLTLTQWCTKELAALTILLERNPRNYKRFFGAATFFFKQYLVHVYEWNVLDKTDDELWEFLQHKSEIPKKILPTIQELLSYAQIIKFADAHALAEKAEEAQEYLKIITGALQTPQSVTKTIRTTSK